MTEENNNPVVGKALYLELRNSPESGQETTYQIILTPEALLPSGRAVAPVTYRRQIGKYSPRSTWKSVGSSYVSAREDDGKFKLLSKEDALASVHDRISYAYSLLKRFTSPGSTWTMLAPIAVEVTASDFEDIRYSKTPYKIIARINRSRNALGFPEIITK
jgi:hypothetical protein